MTVRTSVLKFPDASKFIPTGELISFEIDREEILTIIKRVACFHPMTAMKFFLDGKELNISAFGSDLGEIDELVQLGNSVKKYDLFLYGKNIISCLQHLSCKRVIFSFGGAHHQIMVKPVDSDLDLTYVTQEIRSGGSYATEQAA